MSLDLGEREAARGNTLTRHHRARRGRVEVGVEFPRDRLRRDRRGHVRWLHRLDSSRGHHQHRRALDHDADRRPTRRLRSTIDVVTEGSGRGPGRGSPTAPRDGSVRHPGNPRHRTATSADVGWRTSRRGGPSAGSVSPWARRTGERAREPGCSCRGPSDPARRAESGMGCEADVIRLERRQRELMAGGRRAAALLRADRPGGRDLGFSPPGGGGRGRTG